MISGYVLSAALNQSGSLPISVTLRSLTKPQEFYYNNVMPSAQGTARLHPLHSKRMCLMDLGKWLSCLIFLIVVCINTLQRLIWPQSRIDNLLRQYLQNTRKYMV